MAKTAKKSKTTKPSKSKTKKAKPAARKRAPKKDEAPRTLHTITPYLSINGAATAIDWYKKVFAAKETSRFLAGPDKIMHASLKIGDSEVYLSDIFPGADTQDPSRVGASVTVNVFSKKIDQYWQNAVANGAKVTMPLDDQFWGDRYGKFLDPFGHSWALNWPAKMTEAQKEAKRVEAMKMMAPQ